MKILAFLLAAVAAPGAEPDPAKIELLDALTCRLDAPVYNGFAMAIGDDEHALAARRGWRKVESGNPFMNEYDLPAPVTVAGHYQTTRIGFSASGIVAIVDEPDPRVIAEKEGIANEMDPEPLIRSLVAAGKATRAEIEKSITFHKFMGRKLVVDRKTPPPAGEMFGMHTTIAHEISNVTTHPGKTLYGCSYNIELLDKDGKPL